MRQPLRCLIGSLVVDGVIENLALVTVSENRELTSDSESFWLGTSPGFQTAQSARAFRHE
jgi:hypothetical protein